MANTTIKQRQIAGGLDGWIPAEETWTYASASTITVPSGAASKYQKGDKIKITNNSATKYFYVVGVADTLLTVTGGSDYTVHDSAITSPYFSKIQNPQGFPSSFTYTPTITASSGSFTTVSSSMEFALEGIQAQIEVSITITDAGSATGVIYFTLPLTMASGSVVLAGRENQATGKMLQAVYNSPTRMGVLDYTNNSIIASGRLCRISGTFLID